MMQQEIFEIFMDLHEVSSCEARTLQKWNLPILVVSLPFTPAPCFHSSLLPSFDSMHAAHLLKSSQPQVSSPATPRPQAHLIPAPTDRCPQN